MRKTGDPETVATSFTGSRNSAATRCDPYWPIQPIDDYTEYAVLFAAAERDRL